MTNIMNRIISAGFAIAALGSASVPAIAWTAWPDVDFEWDANAGKPAAGSFEAIPALHSDDLSRR